MEASEERGLLMETIDYGYQKFLCCSNKFFLPCLFIIADLNDLVPIDLGALPPSET